MARATKTSISSRDSFPAGQSPTELKQAILNHLHYTQAKPLRFANPHDWYLAVTGPAITLDKGVKVASAMRDGLS